MLRMDSNLCDWSEEAERMLAPIFADDYSGGVADLKNQVMTRKASLHRVSQEQKTIGYFALRIDALAGMDELVILAGVGSLPGVPLFDVFVPVLVQHAKEAGCGSVRLHCSRKAVLKKAAAQGFAFSEWVMRKKL